MFFQRKHNQEIEYDPLGAEPDAQSVEEEEEHSTQEKNEQLFDEHSDNENVYYTRSGK